MGRHVLGPRRPGALALVLVLASAPSVLRGADSAGVFASAPLFVDPGSNARRQAEEWRRARPDDAAQMDKIGAQPSADWFGGGGSDVAAAVDARVTRITAAGGLPVLVAYNIPGRDCGGYASGGAADGAAYRAWIRGFARGLRGRRAAVVLEPDALGHLGVCGSAAQKRERLELLRDAVRVLKEAGASVYVDAGHSHWMSVDTAVARLRAAGIAGADGFSLNVSNFHPTAEEAAYGRAVSVRSGGKHFVIDTGRNGRGSDGTWCNPDGRALGDKPTASTADPAIDALLWIKPPGESDGTCNGGPPSGEWWPEYALGLARRASH
jgi:endoglucanase